MGSVPGGVPGGDLGGDPDGDLQLACTHGAMLFCGQDDASPLHMVLVDWVEGELAVSASWCQSHD